MSPEATAASARRFAVDSKSSGTPIREVPVSTRPMLASGPSEIALDLGPGRGEPGPPVEVDDAAEVPGGFGRRFVAGPEGFRARVRLVKRSWTHSSASSWGAGP